MPYRILLKPVIESFVDNIIRETVRPVEGSILYCDLALAAEHSGVYVGNNQIVHLDGSGEVEIVTPSQFLARLGGINKLTTISIYVSSKGTTPVGKKIIAQRAREMVGRKRSYSLLLDNCHQFTAGCIKGNFDNSDNFFTMLKELTWRELGADIWRVWGRGSYTLSDSIGDMEAIRERCNDDSLLCLIKTAPEIKNETDRETARFASLLLHYILNKKSILPSDIYYFESLLKEEFGVYDSNFLKELFSLRDTIEKENIKELVEICYRYMTEEDFNRVMKLLERLAIDENRVYYEKYRDINIIAYRLKINRI